VPARNEEEDGRPLLSKRSVHVICERKLMRDGPRYEGRLLLRRRLAVQNQKSVMPRTPGLVGGYYLHKTIGLDLVWIWIASAHCFVTRIACAAHLRSPLVHGRRDAYRP